MYVSRGSVEDFAVTLMTFYVLFRDVTRTVDPALPGRGGHVQGVNAMLGRAFFVDLELYIMTIYSLRLCCIPEVGIYDHDLVFYLF